MTQNTPHIAGRRTARGFESDRSEPFRTVPRPKDRPLPLFFGIVLLFFFALSAAGCGYRPEVAALPEAARGLVIPVVENRTAYGDVSGPLTAALRLAAARAGLPHSASDPNGAALRITVLSIKDNAGTVREKNGILEPVDRIRRIDAEARLDAPDGSAIIPPRRFSVAGRAAAYGNPDRAETQAGERLLTLLDDLAEAVVRDFFIP